MTALYKNYRGENYLLIRNKWEEWYDHSYNAAHDDNAWTQSRADKIIEFLKPFIDLDKYHVIDVGGDTGDIARKLNAKSFEVSDISDRQGNRTIDLVKGPKIALMSHVLEHVDNPFGFVEEMLSKFDLVYVEVPFGVPKENWLRRNKLGQLLQLFFTLHPKLWSMVSRPATGRHLKHLVLCQSEHLSFFKEESLFEMGKRLGCQVTVQSSEIWTPDKSRATVIQCLFRR